MREFSVNHLARDLDTINDNATAVSIEEVTSIESLEAIRDEWHELLQQDPHAQIFSTYDWLTTCWKHFHEPSTRAELWVLLVRINNQLCAIAPFLIQSQSILGIHSRCVRFLGEGPSDYSGFIIANEQDFLLEHIFTFLIQNKHKWDLIELREMRNTNLHFELIEKYSTDCGLEITIQNDSCTHIVNTADGWLNYYHQVFSNKRRKEHRREWRIITESAKANIRFLAGEDATVTLFDTFADIQAGHHEAGPDRPGEFNMALFRAFLDDIMPIIESQGQLFIALLELDDDIVCYYLGFHFRDRLCLYNTAHHSDFTHLSIGKHLMLALIEYCTEHGIHELDMLRGDEPYKTRFSTSNRFNRYVQVNKKCLRSKLRAYMLFNFLPAHKNKNSILHRIIMISSNDGWLTLLKRILAKLKRSMTGIRS